MRARHDACRTIVLLGAPTLDASGIGRRGVVVIALSAMLLGASMAPGGRPASATPSESAALSDKQARSSELRLLGVSLCACGKKFLRLFACTMPERWGFYLR